MSPAILDDVRELLVRAELEAAVELCAYPGPHKGSTASCDAVSVRRQLTTDSIRVSEPMAPRLFKLVREAQRALGHEAFPFELYQVAGAYDSSNACVYACSSTAFIQLSGRIVGDLDDEALLAVIGHELGHHIVHFVERPYDLKLLPHELYAVPETCRNHFHELMGCFKQARELTADRFGLLACRNLNAFARSEMLLAAGLSSASMSFDVEDYVQTCRRLLEDPHYRCGGTTHPDHAFRTYAALLFSETDAYRRVTGMGPAARSIEEVDAEIRRLLRFPKARPLVARPIRYRGAAGVRDPGQEVGPLDKLEDYAKDLGRVLKVRLDEAGGGWKEALDAVLTSDPLLRLEEILERGDGSKTRETDVLADEEDELERRFADLEKRLKDTGLSRRPSPCR